MGRLIEALQQVAPATPVRSLKQDTRARALREARTCYDHLAGRLGVSLMGVMLDRGYLTGGDGQYDVDRTPGDHRAGYGHEVDYGSPRPGRSSWRNSGCGSRPSGGSRAVRITESGQAGLDEAFGIRD